MSGIDETSQESLRSGTVVARQARACLGWPGCFPAGRQQLLAYAMRHPLPVALLSLVSALPEGRTWADCDQMLRESGPQRPPATGAAPCP